MAAHAARAQAPRAVFRRCGTTRAEAASARRSRSRRSCSSPGSRPRCAPDASRGACSTTPTSTACSSPSGLSSAGGIQGFFALLGPRRRACSRACRRSGEPGTYRRARHLLAFAAVPSCSRCARLAAAARARTAATSSGGGADDGAATVALAALEAAFFLWAAGLVVLGDHVVHGFSWARRGGHRCGRGRARRRRDRPGRAPRGLSAPRGTADVSPSLQLGARASARCERRLEGGELLVRHRVGVLLLGERAACGRPRRRRRAPAGSPRRARAYCFTKRGVRPS